MIKWLKTVSVILVCLFLLSGAYYYFTENRKLKTEIYTQELRYDSLSTQHTIQQKEIDILYSDSRFYEKSLKNFEERDRTVRNEVLFFTDEELYNFKNDYGDSLDLTKMKLLPYIKEEFDNLGKRIIVQSNSYDTLMYMMKENRSFLLSIPLIKPIQTKDLYRFSSEYGYRIDPFDRTLTFHEGIDIITKLNAHVLATGWGRVVDVVYSKWGYGNRIVIDHGYGYKSIYAHLNVIYVKEGQTVARGQVIGGAGSSGRSTGVHLHYEVYKNGTHVDPIRHFYSYKSTRSQQFKHLIILQD
jgi:murein DD-endopeptidase MepM/ murein hydrolase activator NlpD